MSAIATLCTHAHKWSAFLNAVIDRRVPCGDEDRAGALARRLKPGCHLWPCREALTNCLRMAIGRMPAGTDDDDVLDVAHGIFAAVEAERRRLLDVDEPLIVESLREASRHPTLPREAYAAVSALADVVRSFARVVSVDDVWRCSWQESHNAALAFVVDDAAPHDAEKIENKPKQPARRRVVEGDPEFYNESIFRDLVEWVTERDRKKTVHDALIEFCDSRGIDAFKKLNRYGGDNLRKILKRWHDTADEALRRAGVDIRTDKARTSRPRSQRKAKAGNRRRP